MLYKCVNGVNVEMSPAEEAEIRREWAEEDSHERWRAIRLKQAREKAQKLIVESLLDPVVAARIRARVNEIESELNSHPNPKQYTPSF